MRLSYFAIVLSAAAAAAHPGHDPSDIATSRPTEAFAEAPAAIDAGDVVLAGTWLFPDEASRVPCVILAGGTMSQTRDGALEENAAGRVRDALRRLARELAAAGYASLRWDKRGHGQTPAGSAPSTNETEAADLAAALRCARAHPRVSAIVVAGESAGGYLACLAAEAGAEPDGYIFLGCLASSSEDLFAYNYGRLAEWAATSPDRRAWAEQHALAALALGHNYRSVFEAARNTSDATFSYEFAGQRFTRSLLRIRTETKRAPAGMFRFIRKPALVLQGDADMNVPPGDADLIKRQLTAAGGTDVTRVLIPGVDHSFQFAAQSEDQRIRDRHSFASFYRPYSPRLYREVTAWLKARFPSSAPTSVLDDGSRPSVIAWNGIRIVENIADATANPGVETLEGRIGPLLAGENGQAHYIDMPPGLFLAEHTHSTESLIYTVRGDWVLCSGGRRVHMSPGSLIWFRAHEPTGWEVPFDAPAYILIFKAPRSGGSDAQLWEYLLNLAQTCEEQQAKGTPFLLADLPRDHPARVFARQINPPWEAQLPQGATTRPAGAP